MQKKVCSKCKIEKGINDFGKKYGKPRGQCKQCEREYELQRREKKKASFNYDELLKTTKICTSCELEKPATEFYRCSRYGLSHTCKSCRLEYYQKNHFAILENKHEYYIKNKEILKEKGINYRKNNKDKVRFNRIKRRECSKFLDCTLKEDDICFIFEKFDNKCFKCGSLKNLAIDHHLPLSKGFGLTVDNAVILCQKCNQEKLNKLPIEFYSREQLLELKKMNIIGNDMITNLNKYDLIDFEKTVCSFFERKKILSPVHLDGGNEDQLLSLFHNISQDDWICGTWRMHYKCLLKGVPKFNLMREIIRGHSISLNFPKYKIISSAIVGGIFSIAVGLAIAEKRKGTNNKVFCFAGEMSFETGKFNECYKYSIGHDLPIVFVLEDNQKSVCSPTYELWGINGCSYIKDDFPETLDFYYDKEGKLYYYRYDPIYPHAGTGKRINF